MATKRPQLRPRGATAQAASAPLLTTQWTINSRSITFIATWRGQLLVSLVAIVLGAIYFVLRGPILKWHRRHRERLSRVRQEELLSMDRSKSSTSADNRAGPSSGAPSGSASAGQKNARERGRDKRKEKKRERCGPMCTEAVASSANGTRPSGGNNEPPSMCNGTSGCSDSSSSAAQTSPAEPAPVLPTESTGPTSLESPISLESSTTTASSATSRPPSNGPESLKSATPTAGDTTITHSQDPPEPSSPHPRTPSVPSLCVDLGSDDGFASDRPGSTSASLSTSTSFSLHPGDLVLPTVQPKKKKRRSKGRSGSDARNSMDISQSLSMTSNLTMSSDDAPQTRSPTLSAPGSPQTIRRKRNVNLGGLPMTPALEMLISSNERTIDSLRAEIGYAKAEESKAREDESRAREDLRRARASEDRMRYDWERSRKARDRAEADARRLEAELMHVRGRFDTLAHMYHAVCTKMREVDMADQPPRHHPQHSPHMGTPGMNYPSPMSSPMAYFPYAGQMMYPSPYHPQGYANFVLSPTPQRRSEGAGKRPDVLAGPLTHGLGAGESDTASTSQVSSPYPSDLSLQQTNETPATSTTGTSDGQLSAAELRRLNIAASVLKKKKPQSESETGDSASSPDSRPASLSRDAREIVEGLGLRTMSGVESAFPSVAEEADATEAPKEVAAPSSSSSDVSSAPTGRAVPETPSDSAPSRYAQSPATLASPSLEVCVELPSDLSDSASLEPTPKPDTNDESTNKSYHDDNDNDNDGSGGGEDADDFDRTLVNDSGEDETVGEAEAEADYVPLFASLAHTPDQLAEIARIRQNAIRSRERRANSYSTSQGQAHSRSCSTSDGT